MPFLIVRHRTRYRYSEPVRLGEHTLMVRPRDSFDQRLIESSLKVSPTPSRIRWIHDAFSNCVTYLDFDASTKELEIESVIRVDHTPENAPDFQIEDYAKFHPFDYHPEELPDLASARQLGYSDQRTDIEFWLRKFLNVGQHRPTGQVLMTLTEAIADGFTYKRRSSPGTQQPAVTLNSKSGTCRDFAFLMMEAARTLGFAARFVTGYIYVPDRDGPGWRGGGSTHAWCQVYIPGSGWVEFDPTNGIVGNRDLIRVAVARMPSQAIPVSGTYYGDPAHELGMEVEVNVKIDAPETPA